MERSRSIERWSDRLTAAGFLIAIAVPLLVQVGGRGGEVAQQEQRAAAPRPALVWSRASLETFPARFDAWYADAFGLRADLVRTNNALEWFGLGISPADNVLRGRDGWLFVTERRALECSLGAHPLTEAELEGWRAALEARHAWCRARGIHYLFVLGPTKVNLYPEWLPAGWAPVGPGRLVQLQEHLAASSDVPLLDLLPALRAEKARDRPELGDFLYYPLGTHWNARGNVTVYRAVLRALGELGALAPAAAVPAPFEPLRLAPGSQGSDSWADRLYLEHRLQQADWRLPPGRPLPQRVGLPFAAHSQGFRNPQATGSLVLYHDSYAALLRAWFGWHFGRVDGYWKSEWETARILDARPTVVVDFMVERMLHLLEPEWLFPDDQPRVEARFRAAGPRIEVAPPRAAPGNDAAAFEGGWRITRKGRFALADLDLPRLGPGLDPVLALDLSAPGATTLELVYPGPSATFDRSHAVRIALEPGRQVVYARLEAARFGEHRSLRLGAQGGGREWILHGVSLRASPRGQ